MLKMTKRRFKCCNILLYTEKSRRGASTRNLIRNLTDSSATIGLFTCFTRSHCQISPYITKFKYNNIRSIHLRMSGREPSRRRKNSLARALRLVGRASAPARAIAVHRTKSPDVP